MGTTYKYDTLPVAAIGTNVNLLDLLKQAYGDEVNNIRSIKIGYFDLSYMVSQNFLLWNAGPATKVTGNANVPSIAGSSTDSSNYIPANLTTIDNAHFKDVTIEVGSSIMNTVHLQVEWSNGLVQDLTVPTIPASVQDNFIGHPGAPTANDVVLAAQKVAKIAVFNPNDCDWIAKDIAAIAGATMDANTWHPDNPALNEEGGFWRIAYRGSDQVKDWQTLVQPGDIVRMSWTDGKPHTVTVTAGLNADGGHANQIKVVDNTDAGGNTIGEHWADFNSKTEADTITIYRLAGDGLYLINGSSKSDTIVGSVWNDDIRGGSGWDVLHGGAGNDYLSGEDGQDILDGGTGADKMYGGIDNDIYIVDDDNDFVSEAGWTGLNNLSFGDMGGVDEVRTTRSKYTLPDSEPLAITDFRGNIENLTYIGTGNFTGTGNSLANTITGGSGTDTLNGGSGADTMSGGDGDDTYIVDDRADVVSEFGSSFKFDAGGKDTVATTLSWYTLPKANVGSKANVGFWDPDPLVGNIENLTYIGTGNFTGTGNALANTIKGGGSNDTLDGGFGNDTLDGGIGADKMYGSTGNDTYIVDDKNDIVSELGVNRLGEATGDDMGGIDEVRTTLSTYTLADSENDSLSFRQYFGSFENLTYTGTGKFTGTGNALANTIKGGAGNDTLDGGIGADTMYGYAGDDIYIVDDKNDVVSELAVNRLGEATGDDMGGIDEVRTTLSTYTLADSENDPLSIREYFGSIENLTYTGAGKFSGTGNALANVITGGGGADTIVGGGGNDVLTGGANADTFGYANGWGSDAITDFELGGKDVLDMQGVIGLNTFSQLTRTDTAQGVKIAFGADSITLKGITKLQLEADLKLTEKSFHFSPPTKIVGSAAPELLTGDALANEIKGLDGNDTLIGKGGADVLDGGIGTDTASYASSAAAVSINLTTGTGTGGDAEGDTLISIERVVGSAFADTIMGSARAEIMEGGDGQDYLYGAGGADTLLGGGGSDVVSYNDKVARVDGGDGWEFLLADESTDATGMHFKVLGSNFEYIGGRGGNDVIDARGVNYYVNVNTYGGNDTFYGGNNNDVFNGQEGFDTFFEGGKRADYSITQYGGDGNSWMITNKATGIGDYIYNVESIKFSDATLDTNTLDRQISSSGVLTGGAGNDVLTGGAGIDQLSGLGGNDTLTGSGGADVLDGGAGTDTASYATSASAVSINLVNGTGQSGDAEGDSLISIERVVGSAFDDQILGSARAETLEGGNGNDIIYGGGGADTVLGGAGNDTISYHDGMRVDGGEGYDTLLADESTVASGIHFKVLGSNFECIGGRGGNDVIDGRGLSDEVTVVGWGGNDTFYGGNGGDVFAGYEGIDTFVEGGKRADYNITQYGGDGNSWLITNKATGIWDAIYNVESIRFTDATLDTATLARQLGGSEGNDTIIGAKGNDIIGGGGGSDTLDGGFGADALTGGLGNDLFIFHKGEANGDVITDFAGNGAAAGDRLQFAGYGAGASFHQVGATDQWQIDYNGGTQHETITLSNHATVHASDVLFV